MNFKELLSNIDQEAFTFGRADLESFLKTEQFLAENKAMVRELYWAVRSNLTANHHEELLTKAEQLQENTK